MLEITLEQFRAMFPRLSNDDAEDLHSRVTAMKVNDALAELLASCDCLAGALYCRCGRSDPPSAEHLFALSPLIETWSKGVETSPAE